MVVSVELLPALDRFGFYFFQCLTSFLWQSSLILAPVLIALRIFRGRSPAIRNSIVLTGFMAIPVILAYSWFMGMPRTPFHPLPVMTEYRDSGRLNTLDNSGGGSAGSSLLQEGRSGGSAKFPDSGGMENKKGVSSAKERTVPAPMAPWGVFSYPWALCLALYVFIQVYLGVKFLLEWGIARWWIWRARTIEDIAVCRVFWRAAFFLEVRTSRFEIMESPSLSIPVTVGAVYPRVILPSGFPERCAPEDFRAVVYHELAHVHRRDPLVLTYISLVRTLLFFHPMVQLAAREFTLIAEQASDEAAIEESGVAPVSYARSLTRVVELLAHHALQPALALGIFRQRSLLFHRLELILSDSGYKYRRFRPFVSTVAVAGLAIFLTVSVSLPLVERDPGSVETTALQQSNTPPPDTLVPRFTACAIPVHNIRIDGDLDDWPGEMARYPISSGIQLSGASNLPAGYGDTFGGASHMMVGYGPDDGLLYVAVTVPDERVITVSDPEWAAPERTDACEVYVDGMHLVRTANENGGPFNAWDLPTMQYVMCPEGGAYDRSAWLKDPPYTPILFRGNIGKTGSRCASRHRDGVTTYEWAVRVYSRYPEQPLRLMTGGVIGFDVAVRDCDHVLGASSWTSWGPSAKTKVFDTSLLGDLVLIDRYEDLGFVSGTITRCREPYANRTLRVYRGTDWIGEYSTDPTGSFRLMVPPGNYTVRPAEVYGDERFSLNTFSVTPGALVKTRFHIAMNGFTRLRYETAAFSRIMASEPGSGNR